MNSKDKLKALFFSFFKIGLFTFGGGYAMIALIEREFVSRLGWIDRDEFLDMIAISESTPGPVAINSATYVGYKVGKVLGALIATIAVCIPSFVIIFAISMFFDAFLALEFVGYAFKGLQVCVAFLIVSAGIRMARQLPKTPLNIIMTLSVIIAMTVLSLAAVSFSVIFYILIGATVGVTVYLIGKAKKEDKK